MKIFLRNAFLLGGFYLIISSLTYLITSYWQDINFYLYIIMLVIILISIFLPLTILNTFAEKLPVTSRYLTYIGWSIYTNLITLFLTLYQSKTTPETVEVLSNWIDIISSLSFVGIIIGIVAATIITFYKLYKNNKQYSKSVSKIDA